MGNFHYRSICDSWTYCFIFHLNHYVKCTSWLALITLSVNVGFVAKIYTACLNRLKCFSSKLQVSATLYWDINEFCSVWMTHPIGSETIFTLNQNFISPLFPILMQRTNTPHERYQRKSERKRERERERERERWEREREREKGEREREREGRERERERERERDGDRQIEERG